MSDLQRLSRDRVLDLIPERVQDQLSAFDELAAQHDSHDAYDANDSNDKTNATHSYGPELERDGLLPAYPLHPALSAGRPAAPAADSLTRELVEHAAGTNQSFAALLLEFGRLASIAGQRVTRVWVPGCGTGEELYALAIALSKSHLTEPAATSAHADRFARDAEPLELSQRKRFDAPRLQLFGTDHSAAAIQIARAARYSRALLDGLSPEQRRRFFVETSHSARIADVLRAQVVFACHDALRDAPLSHIGLLSCRQLLGSMPSSRRAAAFLQFHYAVGGTGLLFVGREQCALVPGELFECLDAEHGVFRARAVGVGHARRRAASAVPLSADRTFERTDLLGLREELRGFGPLRQSELRSLDRAHTELQNFATATQMLSFICDRELRVTRVSTALAERFALHAHAGSLEDLAVQLPGGKRLFALAQEVQQSGQPRQYTEAAPAAHGSSYLVRISPYRMGALGNEGVVGVLTDVTPLERARALAAKRERQHAVIAELGLAALSCGEEGDPSHGLRALAERALGALRDVLGCEYAAVFESCHEPESLLLRAAQGFSLPARSARLSIPEGSELRAALASKTAQSWATPSPSDPLAPHFGGPPPVAGVGCSLRVGESVVGLLAVYRATGSAFAPDDVHCVQAIANILAGAVARLRARRRLSLERGVALAVAETKDLASLGLRVRDAFRVVVDGDDVELWLSGDVDAEGTLQRAWPAEPYAATAAVAPSAQGAALSEQGAALVKACLASRGVRLDTNPAGTELVLPVLSDSALVGALRARIDPAIALDEELLAGIERAASAIGEFVHRARLDEALRQSEQRFRTQSAELESIYATLPVGVALHDRQLRCVRSNRRLEELQAGSASQSGGQAEQPVIGAALLQRVFESGQPARDVELTTGSHGDPREWLCSFAPIKDSEGHVAMVSTVIQDITERKRTEEALRAADRQKDEFLAMLGHELRNPLSAIRNATELLGIARHGQIDLARVHAILDRQTHQMAKLIDGLLDISRIMRGKFELDMTTHDVGRVLREIVQDHAAPQGLRTPHIVLEVPEEPLWVEGDSVRLLQVFENLLSNAVKFTPKSGRITVRVERVEQSAVVRIEDDGAGIDPVLLPHIFEPFRQASQKFGGLGLGLALVRGLVELHGGSVRAASPGPGLGSVFTVTLGLSAAPSRSSQLSTPAHAQLRVMVIEDNEDLAETLAALLRSIGHEVIEVAETGSQGVELARKLHPEVILCDIGLPGELDGLDVARTLRSEPELAAIHLIAMTGYGAPDDRARIRDAGFDACLVKPVELELLQKYLSQSPQPRPNPGEAPTTG